MIDQRNHNTAFIAGLIAMITGVIFRVAILIDGSQSTPFFIAMILFIIGTPLIIYGFFIVIKQYERAVILRFGKKNRTSESGIIFVLPFAESALVIDTRETVKEFDSESMMTADNIPLHIDAILRYKIKEDKAADAVMNVQNFNEIVMQISQVTLRNHVGKKTLQDVLAKRTEINEEIKKELDKEVEGWGLTITGVEIRQVKIPEGLENAMSQKAQALQEKEARITYAESEEKVAETYEKIAEKYAKNPAALQLRLANMMYESVKAKGNTIILIPSDQLNSMGGSSMLAMYEALNKKNKEEDSKDKEDLK